VAGAGAVAGVPPIPGDPAGAVGIPGAPPGEGGIPGGPGQGQGQGQQLAPKGTWEYAIQRLMQMAETGDYSGADEVISKTAKGLAGSIRSGDLNSSQVEAYKTTFKNLNMTNRKAAGGNALQVTLQNGQKQFLQFTVSKEEGGTFRIKDLVIRDGKK